MNPAAYSWCLLTFWLVFALTPGVSAQEKSGEDKGSIASAGVTLVARKTLDAIQSRNATFLSKIVDPAGVYIGVDTSRLSAERFRDQLSKRRGVYCVIFDGCKNETGKTHRTSLRELLRGQSISMETQPVDESQEQAVAVKGSKNSNEVIFTLLFRPLENGWVLQQIEFL